jgi:hypothetical protein
MRLSQVVTYPGVRPVFGGSSLYEWLARGKPVSETWSNYSGALVVIAGVCFTYFLWSWRTLAGSTRRFLVLGAFAASLAVLLFVPGGLGDVLIYLLQQIRALNRGVVILQFLAALLFTMMLARLVSSSWRLRSAGLVFAAVAIVYALVDQSRSPDKATAQSANAAAIADRSFFEKVAAAHHQKPFAMLQLPYQAFPEFSGPNGMGTNDSLVPFILTRNLRTSAASFPQTAAFFNSLNMQDLFRAGRFGDLVRALTESGISSVVFDRRGLSEFEKRRLGQLSLVLAGSLDGGSADQFVHFSLERPVQNAADFQPSGLFLASYGPIGFGLEAVKPSYSKSGGPTAELPQSSIILVNRYEDRQMKAVIQFLAECKTPTTIKILSGGEVGTVGLTNEPFMLNLPVNLAEPQARIALQFDVPPSGCSIRNPAVTFFE